jgi:hypothetical protein
VFLYLVPVLLAEAAGDNVIRQAQQQRVGKLSLDDNLNFYAYVFDFRLAKSGNTKWDKNLLWRTQAKIKNF